jgi:glycerate kinase
LSHLLAAPDKFRGTATAAEVAEAISAAASATGWSCDALPMADGGEGTLEALGGANRRISVTGPLGGEVDAAWRLDGELAIIEMAQASGLALVGDRNDPVAATTAGTGELIVEAIRSGARRVVVALGGSATTDGGWGCLEVAAQVVRARGAELIGACDVTAQFLDAAVRFGPQKGATPEVVEALTHRLEVVAERYAVDFGIDVRQIPGAGAAGGLGGALVAMGGRLVSGFGFVARTTGVATRLRGADLVVTGEGRVDATSVDGKVVGGIFALARGADVPTAVICGAAESASTLPAQLHVLVDRFGLARSTTDTVACITEVTAEILCAASRRGPSPPG